MWYLLETWKKIAIVALAALLLLCGGMTAWAVATGTTISAPDMSSLFKGADSDKESEDDGQNSEDEQWEDDNALTPQGSTIMTELTKQNTIVGFEKDSYEYDGINAVEPHPTVTFGETQLAEGTDYALSWLNNTEVGLGTCNIEGCGAYTGTVATEFVIKSISKKASKKKSSTSKKKKSKKKKKSSSSSGSTSGSSSGTGNSYSGGSSSSSSGSSSSKKSSGSSKSSGSGMAGIKEGYLDD